jgi:3-deoxy-D-manno-octulosonic-acid transferase
MGPIYDKYAEAVELVECGCATIINDSNDIDLKLLHLLNNEEDYFKQSMAAGLYIKSKTGATKRILDYFEEKRLLTN